MFILQQLVFRKQEEEKNIKKLQCALLHVHFLSISSPSNLYCFIPLQNTSSSTSFQNFKQGNSQDIFSWCDIPILPLEYIIRKKCSLSMHSFTVAIINSSYMLQLWISHHQALYIRSIKGNFTPVVYKYLKIISGRYFGLTYKGMWMLHTNKHL